MCVSVQILSPGAILGGKLGGNVWCIIKSSFPMHEKIYLKSGNVADTF